MSRRFSVASVLLLATACGSTEPAQLEVVYRLVEPELRNGARVEPAELVTRDSATFATQTSSAARLPRAMIDDETRHVLATYERGLLAYRRAVEIGAGGRVTAALPAGGAFPGAEAVVVTSQLRPVGGDAWHEPPAALVPLASGPEGRVVRLDVAAEAGAAAPGAAAELNAVGFRAPGATTRYETGSLALPAGARLELSFGVLAPSAAQGPVRFSLEVCEGERCSTALAEVLDPATPSGRVWNERALDLAAFGGTTRSLRFRTEHLPGGGAFTLPVWGDPVVLAPAAAPDPRPSFIVLSIDTLRRDHLDAYGYFRETAPFLREHLADQGVVFDGLVAEAATTDPSHMTLFTSLPALVHGVTRELEVLGVPVTTLAEALRLQRYRTAAFTEDGPLAHDRGFAIGFDAYRENKSKSITLPAGRVEDTFHQARAWLDRNADRPFFLFLHTFQVHAPYEPPAGYRALFTEDEPAARTASQRRTIADYDREIRYVDDQLAELMRFAERRGLGANTVWVVLSDHGEAFWEHGSLGHGTLRGGAARPADRARPGRPSGPAADRPAPPPRPDADAARARGRADSAGGAGPELRSLAARAAAGGGRSAARARERLVDAARGVRSARLRAAARDGQADPKARGGPLGRAPLRPRGRPARAAAPARRDSCAPGRPRGLRGRGRGQPPAARGAGAGAAQARADPAGSGAGRDPALARLHRLSPSAPARSLGSPDSRGIPFGFRRARVTRTARTRHLSSRHRAASRQVQR